jgi:hypothetical protein
VTSDEPITVSTASHVGDAFSAAIDHCADAVAREAAITHLSHYSQGVHNFSVDRLGEDEPWRRDELVALGRRLSFQLSAFERMLRDARTGPLIRMVVQSGSGAAICVASQPGDHLVGVALAPADPDALPDTPPVRSADIGLSWLANDLRARTRLWSQNPGGWQTADVEFAPIIGTVPEPRVSVRVAAAPEVDRVAAAAVEALSRKHLHFVAYYVDGEVALTADTLAEPDLGSFFTQIHVDVRRRFYLSLSRQLAASAITLNRTITPLPGGRLLRLVLDVEQGAVYYYRLEAGRYLVGVTLDQSGVAHGDLLMAELTQRIRADG